MLEYPCPLGIRAAWSRTSRNSMVTFNYALLTETFIVEEVNFESSIKTCLCRILDRSPDSPPQIAASWTRFCPTNASLLGTPRSPCEPLTPFKLSTSFEKHLRSRHPDSDNTGTSIKQSYLLPAFVSWNSRLNPSPYLWLQMRGPMAHEFKQLTG